MGSKGCCSKFRLGAEGRLGAYWPKIAAWFCRGLVQRFKVSELVVGAFGGIS